MVKAAAVDFREFARFVITGVTATIGNIAVVWLVRFFVSFEVALLAGIAAGVSISFMLSKLFAFASRSWQRAGGEAIRFLVVYAVSCATYFGVAVVSERSLLIYGVLPQTAEMAGVLFGAGTMMLTSYFGHRFFTYRTYQRAVEQQGPTS